MKPRIRSQSWTSSQGTPRWVWIVSHPYQPDAWFFVWHAAMKHAVAVKYLYS